MYKKKSSIFSGGLSFIIEMSEKRDSLLKSKAEELKEEDFVLFEPFFTAPGASSDETLNKKSYGALYFILIMLMRRIILLYTAMFLTKLAWL